MKGITNFNPENKAELKRGIEERFQQNRVEDYDKRERQLRQQIAGIEKSIANRKQRGLNTAQEEIELRHLKGALERLIKEKTDRSIQT